MARASRADLSYEEIDQAVRRIDRLDDPVARDRAMELVAETDGDGLRLINDLGVTNTKRLLRLSVDGVDTNNLRQNLFQLYGRGEISADDIATFTKNVEEFKGKKGMDKVLEDISSETANKGNFRGASNHLKIAAKLRKQDDGIAQFEKQTDLINEKNTKIDIITENENIIEVKSERYATVTKEDISYNKFTTQISKYIKYRDERNLGEVIVYFTKKPSQDVLSYLRNKNGIDSVKLYQDGTIKTLV